MKPNQRISQVDEKFVTASELHLLNFSMEPHYSKLVFCIGQMD